MSRHGRGGAGAADVRLEFPGREVVRPSFDLCEHEAGYRIKCDMPGLDKDDINLRLEADVLCLQAESRLDLPAGMKVHALEFSGLVYKLSLDLPPGADGSLIRAAYVDGVLVLELPKKKGDPKTGLAGRRISIKGC